MAIENAIFYEKSIRLLSEMSLVRVQSGVLALIMNPAFK